MSPFKKKSLLRKPEHTLRKWSFAQKKKPKKTSFWKWVFLLFLLLILGGVAAGWFLFSTKILKDLPDITDPHNIIFSESTILFDKTGENILYTIHGDQSRKMVSIDHEISPHIIAAILSAEDDQFYSHAGFDVGGITKAFCHEILGNVMGLCPPRGGSTLTQQLVKNFFLTPERTMTRKFREIVLSYQLEQEYSKNEILEIYLNGISFGSNLGGVETASQAFFGVSAKDVSAAQASVLAAIPQAPTKYSPFGKNVYSHLNISPEVLLEQEISTREDVENIPGESWTFGLIGQEIPLASGKSDFFSGRSDLVLSRMRDLGYISETEFQSAKKELKNMIFAKRRQNITAPHFVMWVKQELEDQFGADLVGKGGLKVITTIDLEAQKIAEEVIQERVPLNTEKYNTTNAALVALHPQTGEVEALVGSADYWNSDIDGEVNIILRKRLPGSSFKPIVYTAAFLAGKLSPASILFDVETNFGQKTAWKPKNYDGRYRGMVSVREALGTSLNTPAVKAAIIAGVKNVYTLATEMGISFDAEPGHYGAAIALGGAEARPLDMAIAFSVFANGGKKVTPTPILSVTDRYGNILASSTHPEEPEQIVDPGVAYLMNNILSDKNARAPGWNTWLQLEGRENIVKTGTADKKVDDISWASDCWTIGGTPELITTVWTGNSDGSILGKNASGLAVAAPIWHTFMTRALEGKESSPFEVPSTVHRAQVSRLSGKLPAQGMRDSLITTEVFSRLNLPTTTDDSLALVTVDSVSGRAPNKYTPKNAIETRSVLRLHSYFPSLPHWEDPVKKWVSQNTSAILKKYSIAQSILPDIPEEVSTVHTEASQQNAPTIAFASPISGGIVSAPRASIVLNTSTKNGFGKALFLWNGTIVKSFGTKQDFYVIPIPQKATGQNTITVQITDDLLYTAEESISVVIGSDTDLPRVDITSPSSGEEISGGSNITFSASAQDVTGAVERVDFFLDGKKLISDYVAPYTYEWPSPNASKKYALRAVAYDRSGNKQATTHTFSVKKQSISSVFGIISPKNNTTHACNTPVNITGGVSNDLRKDFSRLEIQAKSPSGVRRVLGSFEHLSGTGYFHTGFTPEECGEWQILEKVFLKSGSQRTSGKILLLVE